MSDRKFLFVSVFTLVSGIITGIVIAPFVFAPPDMKHNVIKIEEKKNTMTYTTAKKIEAPIIEGSSVISIFSADSGTLEGMNTYLFENPKLTELWPGTRQAKTVLTAQYARIIFKSGNMSEVKDSRWWGNLKRAQYKLAKE